MSVERRLARKERRDERKEAKNINKENKKARKRGEVFETTTNEVSQLEGQILTTNETGNALAELEISAIDKKINNLCNFNTYGELLSRLNDAESLLLEDKKAKRYGLGKSGKIGVKDVNKKSKLYLERIRDRRKRVEKEKHPYVRVLPMAEKAAYLRAMNPIQSEIRNFQYDKASGFTNTLSSLAHGDVSDTKNTRKTIDRTRNTDKYKQELNGLLNNAFVVEAFDNRLDYANTFLTNAIHGNLTQADLIFYNTHQQQLNTALAGTDFPILIQDAYRRCSITPEDYRRECSGDVDLRGMSFTDSLKRGSLHGGVSWLLQQGKMPPQSASNWANLASLAALGFAGYRLFKGAKKIGGGGFWGTAGSLGLLLGLGQLVSQFTMGKGLIDNVKGLLWGGDNMVSGMIDLFSKRTGGNNTDVQSCVGGANQQFFENYYRKYDKNNQLLALPLLFPNTTLGGLQQQIQQFKNNPSQWSNFYSNAMRMYERTIPGAIVDTHCSSAEALESWLNDLHLPLSDTQRQNEKLDDIVFESFINQCLKDNGYEVAPGHNVKQLVHYVKISHIEDPGMVFDKLKGANLIIPKTTVDPEADRGEDARLKTILTNEDSLKNYLFENGYQLKAGTIFDQVKQFFQEDTQKNALKEKPDDQKLPFELLKKAQLIEQVNYSDPDIGTLKTTCSNVLDGLGDKKDTYWNAIENLAKNTSKDSGIELKQGEDGKFIFYSYGKETSIDWKKGGIVGFNNINPVEMLVASSEDELIQTAHLVNRAKQWLDNHPGLVKKYIDDNKETHPERTPITWINNVFTGKKELKIAGQSTGIVIPEVSYITKNSESFCSFLQAYALKTTGS